MFQRFSFENLPPERKVELLEKQRKQQQQRELLLQQIESRKREKNNAKENENSRDLYQEQTPAQQFQPQPLQPPIQPVSPYQFQQNTNQFQPTTIDFSKTSVTPSSFRKQQLVFTPQNYSLLPERQVRKTSAGVTRERQLMSMSLTPNTIHDAFASLRHQIMSNAASSVIGGADTRAMRETKMTDTF